jgi:2-polyprenyl-3-methyl-5-hydroxy-6-metoxy-1,4-benzoquinol methylase
MASDIRKTWNACGEAFHRFTTATDSYSENIERPIIERLAGDVTGLRILDLACGSGVYSIWFAGRGAKVVGLDLSEKMIALAKDSAAKNKLDAEFKVADMTQPISFEAQSFDLVFTATALHYVENLSTTMREVARVLKPAGHLIASVLHPMGTARFPLANWEELPDPSTWEPQYFGSARRSIETPWAAYANVAEDGQRISCNHHTIEAYWSAITGAGLKVTDLAEPYPPEDFASRNLPRYEEAMRVPIYLIFKARH